MQPTILIFVINLTLQEVLYRPLPSNNLTIKTLDCAGVGENNRNRFSEFSFAKVGS